MNETPMWLQMVIAALVMFGGALTLIGSFGLLRLGTFFQRIHAPTLGATLGVWSLTLATVVQVSHARGQVYLHTLLIAVFIALTAPVTTLFLMRAAVFRARVRGDRDVPAPLGDQFAGGGIADGGAGPGEQGN